MAQELRRSSSPRTVSVRRLTGRLALVTTLLPACVRPPAPPPSPPAPAPGIYYEEDLRVPDKPQVEIIDLRETVSEDQQRVSVTGTVINRGTKTTAELSVKVNALDAQDAVVLSVFAVPSTSRLAPGGGTATFTATLDNRAEVRRYHVEAMAK